MVVFNRFLNKVFFSNMPVFVYINHFISCAKSINGFRINKQFADTFQVALLFFKVAD